MHAKHRVRGGAWIEAKETGGGMGGKYEWKRQKVTTTTIHATPQARNGPNLPCMARVTHRSTHFFVHIKGHHNERREKKGHTTRSQKKGRTRVSTEHCCQRYIRRARKGAGHFAAWRVCKCVNSANGTTHCQLERKMGHWQLGTLQRETICDTRYQYQHVTPLQ